jgi:hypothetical protein
MSLSPLLVPAAPDRSVRIDLVAFDVEGGLVLFGEVKAVGADEDRFSLRQLLDYADRTKSSPPFLLTVNRERIRIYRFGRQGAPELTMESDTAPVFGFYDPAFAGKKPFEDYLTVLANAWLDDLAFHWKSETPPLYSEAQGIGLVPLLDKGTVQREVALPV